MRCPSIVLQVINKNYEGSGVPVQVVARWEPDLGGVLIGDDLTGAGHLEFLFLRSRR